MIFRGRKSHFSHRIFSGIAMIYPEDQAKKPIRLTISIDLIGIELLYQDFLNLI